jgi:hypothetical protein
LANGDAAAAAAVVLLLLLLPLLPCSNSASQSLVGE